MWFENILWLLGVSYALFTLGLWRTWKGMRDFRPASGEGPGIAGELMISVVIPVRNEAGNITALLEDLDRQSLHKSLFEVWVADDNSTDETKAIVKDFAARSDLNLRLLELSDDRAASPKKRAINAAVQRAGGLLIVTTDGDCRAGEEWLSVIASFYRATGAKCISGPVTFTEEETLTDYLQTVEFSSLVGSGACAIAAMRPTMCNGANFAYERAVFFEVGGFEGVDQIASGDDELLMQKIAKKYPDGIYFLKSQAAVVRTAPHKTWEGFKSQRQRWASKWKHYESSWPKVLAVFVFLSSLSVLSAVVAYATGALSGYTALALILLRILPEWLFIGSVLRFLEKEQALPYIPLVQVIYPFYVLFFGLAGQKGVYRWKGRRLR
ncbi:MAG: glycosyl transferase family 2 [Cytophagaceae bacterium SCN 52-12]|mgnify:CR=1 FL=1|nr:MAG: glycosyl transferase family 2 [Cytophagaceae bacterium SCN 52-12]